VLTKSDDFPIHQISSPISEVGAPRNFYDRYFFNGYSKDGKIYFAAAMCVYPNLNIIDAAFTISYDGFQHNCRASRVLNEERLNTKVGSIDLTVIEPLKKIGLKVNDENAGISADIIFEGIFKMMQEPKMIMYNGPRLVMDTFRGVQHGKWKGKINLKGKIFNLEDLDIIGVRDRSWGVRPVGKADSQPVVPFEVPQFYWLWCPMQFKDFAVQIHFVDDENGRLINGNSVIQHNNKNDDEFLINLGKKVKYQSNSRRVKELSIFAEKDDGSEVEIKMTPKSKNFMCGIGYMHPEWGHGHYKGENETFYDFYDLSDDPHDPPFLHIQSFCDVTFKNDGNSHGGFGVLEELIIGPHKPSGFKDLFDKTNAD